MDKISKLTLSAAKSYTNKSLEGGGAVAGKPCQIQSITDITGGKRITFIWYLNDGTTQTSTMDVMNGVDGTDGQDGKGIASVTVNEESHLIITYDDGTTTDAGAIEVHSAVDSVNGKTGEVTLDASDVGALPDDTTIPSKTSDLTNDSNFVADANYVHTDNNYDATAKGIVDGVTAALSGKVDKVEGKGLSTNDYDNTAKGIVDGVTTALGNKVDKNGTDRLMTAAEGTKLEGIAAGAEANVQSDWNQTTNTADDYIKNKPTLGTAAAKDVPALGNASTTEVVMGDDTRLSDSRPASDVPSWAKETNKPSYSASEIAYGANSDVGSEIQTLTDKTTACENFKRRTRRDISSDLTNLPTAISEQNLEKYGYSIGDYFTGASGYTYIIGDNNTFYGGYNSYAVLDTPHIGLVVKTGATCAWNDKVDNADTTATGYNGSKLHNYLKTTVLNNIKSDMIALFGGTTGLEHLLSHQKLLTTAVSSWAWQTDQYISALSEVQVYSSRVWGIDGYQTGEACKPLEVFQKFRFNEILGNIWFWLRDIMSASDACYASNRGNANSAAASADCSVVGLILFH